MAHYALGWCVWDLPALIILVAGIVAVIVHRNKIKKRERELNDELARISADAAVDAAEAEK